MASGEFRERVEIVNPVRTKRADGGYDVVHTTTSTVWASVRPLSAREQEREGRSVGVVSYLFTMYRRTDLTQDQTLRWVGRDMNIKQIRLPMGRDLYIEVVADYGVAK